MSKDGNLAAIFSKNLRMVHWQSVESFSTGHGVPDRNGCFRGIECWIENKKCTSGTRLDHNLSPEQIGWIERRCRAGGRVFIAVRKEQPGGVRRGPAVDDLWLYHGRDARAVAVNGLLTAPAGKWAGGPAKWDWDAVLTLLFGR